MLTNAQVSTILANSQHGITTWLYNETRHRFRCIWSSKQPEWIPFDQFLFSPGATCYLTKLIVLVVLTISWKNCIQWDPIYPTPWDQDLFAIQIFESQIIATAIFNWNTSYVAIIFIICTRTRPTYNNQACYMSNAYQWYWLYLACIMPKVSKQYP